MSYPLDAIRFQNKAISGLILFPKDELNLHNTMQAQIQKLKQSLPKLSAVMPADNETMVMF
jgi:hypothetical protein